MRGRLVGLSFSHQAGSGWYLPLGHHYMGMPDQIPAADALEVLRPLLEDPAVQKVGQDLKRDLLVLERAGVKLQGIAFDTMLASYLLDPIAKHHLHDMAAEHLGIRTLRYEEVAGKGAKRVTLDQVDVERVRDYAAEEADVLGVPRRIARGGELLPRRQAAQRHSRDVLISDVLELDLVARVNHRSFVGREL